MAAIVPAAIILAVSVFAVIEFFAGSLQTTESRAAATCNDSLLSGSFIINTGSSAPTFANSLYPYGMVYDLITNYQVPIIWSINPSKVKDGADFTYNSVQYKGGPFIVPKQFITPAVAGRITYWTGQGVLGTYTTSNFLPPVYDTLTSFPKVMIDTASGNDNIIIGYYNNALIPATAYAKGVPANLSGCVDIWTNPHDDPTWASHNYLYNFVTANKGFIWAECHEVSVMESVKNPVSPFTQLNFLTTTGLQCYKTAKCNSIGTVHANNPTTPFTNYYPSDPNMQFIGNMATATQGGSEKWYIPANGGAWNGNARRTVTTSDGTSPVEGVLMVYGPAYGNVNNGTVMYIAGHDLNSTGSLTNKVAAQRCYLNFILYTGLRKRLNISMTAPATAVPGTSYAVTSTVSAGSAPYSYQWSSTLGGTFTSSTSANTSYSPPVVINDTIDIIRIKITDNCGRVNFKFQCVNVNSSASSLPVTLISFAGEPRRDGVHLDWVTSSEINNDYFSVQRSENGINYSDIGRVKGHGNTTVANSYSFTDVQPLTGYSYYKLRQVDFDGTATSSQAVAIFVGGSKKILEGLVVTPNPFSDKASIRLNSLVNGIAEIQIYTIAGKLCVHESVQLEEGMNTLNSEKINSLASGIYFFQISSEGFRLPPVKLVKK